MTERPRARAAIIAAVLFMVASVAVGGRAASGTVSFLSGTVDAAGVAGPTYSSRIWTPPTSGTFVVELAWTGGGALRMDMKRQSDKLVVAASPNGTSPTRMTASVTAGTAYKVGVWSNSGSGTFDVRLLDPVVALGWVDAAGVASQTTAWTPTASGTHHLTLGWTGSGDLRFEVRRAGDGSLVADSLTASNPKSLDAAVIAGTAYRITVWARSGSGKYTVVQQPPSPAAAPNILLIVTDDQRRDALRAMPAVTKWFATGGVIYTNGYVTTPSCCPSRAAIMTGRYDHNNGVIRQTGPAFDESTSIAAALKGAGYTTGTVGKYVHYYDIDERAPYWDRWTYWTGGYIDVQMNVDGTVVTSNGYSTRIAFDTARSYLDSWEANDSRPWLLQIAPTAPHLDGPDPPPAEAKYATATVPPMLRDPSTFEADISDKPPFLSCCTVTENYIARVYAAMTRAAYTIDEGVDQVFQKLAALGELDNTLAIFVGDNGWMFGDHQLRSKFFPYANSVGVPFLLRWPGHVAAGTTDARFAANVDIAPTMLAAAGVTPPVVQDGRNLVGGAARSRALTEYWDDPANGAPIPTWAALTTTTYHYVEYYGTDRTTVVFREYYDLRADPYELTNLLGDGKGGNDPDVTALHAQLKADRTCAGSACP